MIFTPTKPPKHTHTHIFIPTQKILTTAGVSSGVNSHP